MHTRYTLLFCLLILAGLLHAQATTWHKQFAPAPLRHAYCQLYPEGSGYVLSTDKLIVQIDLRGQVSGLTELPSPVFASGVCKKYDSQTGHPYFVVARRNSLWNTVFKLTAYQPGQGHVHELEFPDSLGSIARPRPLLLDLGADSYLVFSRKFYHKVHYSPNTGFTLEWTRPLSIPPIAVVQQNNRLILADENGRVQALDADGNELWLRQHAITLYALKPAPGGFIGAGLNAANQAAVIALNADGQESWSAGYGEKAFYNIIPTSDGGYAAVGLSAGLETTLVKLDATGTVSWKQTYGEVGSSGGGGSILEVPDGGFLLAGKGKAELQLIRTDDKGNAPAPEPGLIGQRRLKTGSLQVDISPGPSLFFNGNSSSFISLADSGAATLLAFSPWLGGIDENQEIRVAAAEYAPYLNSDYRAGTHSTAAGDFERVWAVSQAEIQKLRADFLQDQVLNDPVPLDVLQWPAKGNPYFKYRLDFAPVESDPMEFPAPFVDANGDGLYNVYDGDYPKIKGDHMAWLAFTDSTEHARTYGQPLVADFQVSVFTYDCVQIPLLDQSLFVDYQVINQSGSDYTDTHLGFFADPDLGCYLDDYFGTMPQVDSWYAYNQDAFDQNCQGVQGFGAEIPVQSVSFLNQSLDHTIYYINPSLGTPPPGITDPNTVLEYYRYLQGRWRDGAPLTIGGNGYNQFNMNITDYFFPDNPSDPLGWSMCTTGQPFFDRRVVSSHGPFQLSANDTFRLQLAFTLHSDIPHPCPDIFGQVVPALEQLQQWHADAALELHSQLEPVYFLPSGQILNLDATVPLGVYAWSTGSMEPVIPVSVPGTYSVTITGATGCTRVETVQVQQLTGTGTPAMPFNWKIWPNPASDLLYLDCPDCKAGTAQATLFNAQGQVVRRISLLSTTSTLDLKNLPPGLYWLEIRNASGLLGMRRVVLGR